MKYWTHKHPNCRRAFNLTLFQIYSVIIADARSLKQFTLGDKRFFSLISGFYTYLVKTPVIENLLTCTLFLCLKDLFDSRLVYDKQTYSQIILLVFFFKLKNSILLYTRKNVNDIVKKMFETI